MVQTSWYSRYCSSRLTFELQSILFSGSNEFHIALSQSKKDILLEKIWS